MSDMDVLVDGGWLERELGAADLRIVDCSVPSKVHDEGGFELNSGLAEWEEGHIPGSRHVDLLEDLSDTESEIRLMRPAPERIASVMEGMGVGDGDRVVLYDSDVNMWAARVWFLLRSIGVDSAAILDGGFPAWRSEGRPIASGSEPLPERASLTVKPRAGVFVDKEDVIAALEDPSVCLIDALQPETFRGERSDYGRPGHIPGARNVPFASLVDPAPQRYLPPEDLRARFAETPALEADRVITYCGGAVAAASAAFALALIGVERVAVYDGSLLEWAADPSLPLVTGASRDLE